MKLPVQLQGQIRISAVFLCLAGVISAQPELPDGDGKQQVEQLCTGCHSLQPIISARHTRAEWRAEVDNMVGLGAEGTDHELNAVVEYLNRNYGKSSLNWTLCGAGAGLLFGVLLLGRYRRLRRNPQQDNRSVAV